MKLNELTIKEAHNGLTAKDMSVVDLVRDCITAIKEENHKINAFITVFEESAMAEARRVDEKISRGEEIGQLEGIPLAVKDNMLIQGTRAAAGSKILENYISAYDATVIEKLRKEGAIFLGKTNMDEFAMGSSTESSYFGPTKNPVNHKMVPGGSSGGSAAAVAANMCLGALGSDTGGSIRQPASLCGIVGMKPSYGRVSRYGLMAMASSLDQIGPFAKTVADAEIIYKAIVGKDKRDSTTVEENFGMGKEVEFKKLRIGLPKEYFSSALDNGIKDLILEKVNVLAGLGAEIKEVSLPHTDYGLAVYYVLMPAEVSSNLARYDGIRYGYSVYPHTKDFGVGAGKDKDVKAQNLREVYEKSRAIGFGAEAQRRIMIGAYALSAGYYDAYYKKASAVRAIIKREFADIFNQTDCLITPTSPSVAWPIGEKINDPLKMYLADIYTVSANITGIPGISIPCGEKDGLPVGLQVLGKNFDENTMFRVAQKLFV